MTERNQTDDPTSRSVAAPDVSPEVAATMAQAKASFDTSQTGVPSSDLPNSTPDFPLPTQFGRYKIEKELGKGAMGVVYLAEDTTIGRKVALKIPKKAVLEESDVLERFYREAKTTGTLRHPNICPVFDVGCIDGTHYLTMAYIPGKLISSFLTNGKLPAAKKVALLIRKIALALAEAHRNGIIHRDLKPSNVMLDEHDEPIVMDFGLACQVNTEKNARLTQSGAILGTPAYMAPEQVAGEIDRIGPCSDIYALGVMLYQFLTGELPFRGPIMAVFAQVLRDQPQRPSELRPDVAPALEAVCLKMMAKKPAERFASMKEVAAALTEYVQTGKISGFEETVTFAGVQADAPEPSFENLAEFANVETSTYTLRKETRKLAKKPPLNAWNRLRQHPWFWPATGGLTALPLFVLLAVILVLRNDKGIEGPQAIAVTKNGTRLLDLSARTGEQNQIPTAGGNQPSSPVSSPTGVSDRIDLLKRLLAIGADINLGPSGTSSALRVHTIESLPPDAAQRLIVGLFFFRSEPIPAESLAIIKELPHLERLVFRSAAQPLETWPLLASVHRLRELELADINDDVVQALPALPGLSSLEVTNSKLLSQDGLIQLGKFSQLERLTLVESTLTDRDLEHFPSWPKLTSLSLSMARIDGHGGNELPKKCPKLSNLDLYGCSLNGQQLAWLGQLPLEQLKLSLGTNHDMRIDQLPQLPRLKKLMFSVSSRLGQQNKVVPQFSEFRPTELAWLQSCLELRELEVWSLSDQQVAQLSVVRDLQKLIICYTDDLTPQTLQSLQPLPKLEHLYLLFCNVNDAHAPVVAKFDRLAGLMLTGTKLTPDGMKLIRAGLPRCQISTDK